MNPEIKEQFVTALESGMYPQASGRLVRYEDNELIGFCCIGVLSDLAVKAGVAEWRPYVSGDNAGLGIVPKGADEDAVPEAFSLPLVVAEWAEVEIVEEQDIFFGPDRATDSLIALNDQFGQNFEQIAQVVKVKL